MTPSQKQSKDQQTPTGTDQSNFISIRIRSAPRTSLRNNQVGDWWYSDSGIGVTVLETLPQESQLAIAVHELVEAWECRKNGITDKEVCAFDEKYEAERKEGKHGEYDEPGDDPRSPYRQEHMAATHVERAVCAAIGLSWTKHSLLESLSEGDHQKKESPDAAPSESRPEPPLHVLD